MYRFFVTARSFKTNKHIISKLAHDVLKIAMAITDAIIMKIMKNSSEKCANSITACIEILDRCIKDIIEVVLTV